MDDAVKRWLIQLLPSTRKTYQSCLFKFFDWLKKSKKMNVTPIEAINENFELNKKSKPLEMSKWSFLVLEYINSLKGSPTYKLQVAKVIQSFFKHNGSPLQNFSIPITDEFYPPRLDLSLENVKLILPYLNDLNATIVLCLLYSGMRINEFLSLKAENIIIKGDFIQIPLKRFGKLSRAKISGSGFTLLGGEALNKLKPYLKKSGQIFSTTARSVERAMISAAKKAGLLIETEKKTPSNRIIWQVKWGNDLIETDAHPFHPHALRALFKTEASHIGIPEELSEFWMGHAGGIKAVYDKRGTIHFEDHLTNYKKLVNHFDKELFGEKKNQ